MMNYVVYIDHDYPYDEYDIGYYTALTEKLPVKPDKIEIRKSCSGNVHMRLSFFSTLISDLDTLFIRAIMLDDSRRLRADMERYYLKTREINLCFAIKLMLETGEVFRAGEWVEIKR